LGEVLSDCGIAAAGVVDADALPTSEKLSPAAPNILAAAALVVRFCFEACLTRDMVASSVNFLRNRFLRVRSAKPACKDYFAINAKHLIQFHSSS
jgi:hypothetical protein